MNKKIRNEAVDFLFDAILCLKNREECYLFFDDLCTVNELLSMSQRFEVAFHAGGSQDLSGDRGKDGRFHRHHQPRQ